MASSSEVSDPWWSDMQLHASLILLYVDVIKIHQTLDAISLYYNIGGKRCATRISSRLPMTLKGISGMNDSQTSCFNDSDTWCFLSTENTVNYVWSFQELGSVYMLEP